MDARPQIDFDRLHDILAADKAYQDTHSEPKQPPLRFCGADCREAYREDRIQGKPLSGVSMAGQHVSHKEMCARLKVCGYCLSKLEK